MNNLLEGKVAIVTGAGAGIGKATAILLAEEGAFVYALDIKGLEWIDSFSNASLKVLAKPIDICDFAAVKTVVMDIKKEHGHIDVLANIAGLISYELMPMINYDFFPKDDRSECGCID